MHLKSLSTGDYINANHVNVSVKLLQFTTVIGNFMIQLLFPTQFIVLETSVGKHSFNMNLRIIAMTSNIIDKLEKNSQVHL